MTRVVLALGLLWALIVVFWPMAHWVLGFDDSFYYYTLARNLAAGHGFTFDRINPTNGFHPLWLFTCVPLYGAGLDGLAAVRVALLGQVLLWTGALVLLSRRLRLRGALQGAVLALAAGGPAVFKTFVSGMEAGLVLPLHAALLVAPTRTSRQRFGVACLGSLAFLARTDAGFLLLWFGLFSLRRPFRELVELFLLPGAVIIAFLVVNQITFGAPLQVSGLLKFTAPSLVRTLWIVVCIGAPLVLTRARSEAFPLLTGFVRERAWYAAFVGTIVAWYTGVQTFPRMWYFAPAVLFGILVLVLAAGDLARLAAREGSRRALTTILLVPLAAGYLFQWAAALDPRGTAVLRADADAGAWITENMPSDTILGSWDAGVVGYFASQRVINLDGVVNSPVYLRALRSGTTAAFLADEGLAYVVNHDRAAGAELVVQARRITGREPVLERRWDYTFAGASNRDDAGVHAMGTFLYSLRD